MSFQGVVSTPGAGCPVDICTLIKYSRHRYPFSCNKNKFSSRLYCLILSRFLRLFWEILDSVV